MKKYLIAIIAIVATATVGILGYTKYSSNR